ncbi:MAG: lipase family protein [Marinobacterium sp.]|nr:lipase family protein [Marinobacterium sp.]
MKQIAPLVSSLDEGNAYWMARIASALYMKMGDRRPEERMGKEDSAPDEERILASLKTEDPGFVSVYGADRNSAQGAVIEHERYLCLAFRGTDELADWVDNIDVRNVDTPEGVFHRGFLQSVEDLWQPLNQQLNRLMAAQPRPIFITGHSLGGAMATVAAARFLYNDRPFVSVYTFGQPRAVEEETAERFNQACKARYFRFHNNNDIVTRVPARIAGYGHVGSYLYISEEVEIHVNPTRWFLFMDYIDGTISAFDEKGIDGIEDHNMGNYLAAIERWDFKG